MASTAGDLWLGVSRYKGSIVGHTIGGRGEQRLEIQPATVIS
jgi:hypothetical protein